LTAQFGLEKVARLSERRRNACINDKGRSGLTEDHENGEVNGATLKGRTGIVRLFNAFGYSLAGLKAAYTGEAAFRQLVWLNVVLLPAAFLFDVSRAERAVMLAVVILALVIELFNSAIEAVVDRISLSLHPLSKRAKDMGSAAQLIGLLIIAVVWATVLL